MPDPILFYATNRKTPPVTFPQALLKGIAPDGGIVEQCSEGGIVGNVDRAGIGIDRGDRSGGRGVGHKRQDAC